MLRLCLVSTALFVSCTNEASTAREPAAKAEPVGKAEPASKTEPTTKPEPTTAPEPTPDPLITKICAAYDEEIAANPSTERILSRVAVRVVTKHGVSESQLSKIGPNPPDLLAAIRAGGDPPECKAFVTALEAIPPSP